MINEGVQTIIQIGPPSLLGEEGALDYFTSLAIFLLVMFLYSFYAQKIQLRIWINKIEKSLSRIEKLAMDGKKKVVSVIVDNGAEDKSVARKIDEISEFFMIEPVDRDPSGVLSRLEHLLNVRKSRFASFVNSMVPRADPETKANLEVMLEAIIALNTIYRIVRHYLILGKKTQSLIIIMQLEMQIPLIEKIAEAYYNALDAFIKGIPIGDGIGPLSAVLLANGNRFTELNDGSEFCKSEVDVVGRRVIVLKAKGPGGRVGKPGLAVKNIVRQLGGSIARIITVDAALKLEGDRSGDVIEGVGAAIGDPGPEKYKIEEVATKYGIPLDAIVVKVSAEEAVMPMKKQIADAAEVVVERIKRAVVDRVREKGTVLVVGIGNTLGIGQ